MTDVTHLQYLALAAAIGFLIGFEREWQKKSEAKTRTFAGARTFTFIAVVGGLAGLVSDGGLVVAVGLASVALFAAVAYWAQAREQPGAGGTTEVAVLVTYLLGVAATRGEPVLAAAGGVATAILLAMKPTISGLASTVTEREIGAALRFLAISVIVLPVLPDQGYGPYEALNPRAIWWMVVLISGLSFTGYWLTKIYGARGVLVTGLVGGLASSTATTLSLSRQVKDGVFDERPAAVGVIAANIVMLLRVGVLLSVLSVEILSTVAPALGAGALAGAVVAALMWRGGGPTPSQIELGNPMELKPAIVFAALLAVVAVASRFAADQFGDQGLYGLAFVTGLADVDALTLTAASQAKAGAIARDAAAVAVIIAVGSNMVVKAAMAWSIAGAQAGAKVATGFAVIVAAAVGAVLLAP